MLKKHAIAALGALGICLQAQAAELTFVTWGGFWQEAQEATLAKPFTAKTKINVKIDSYNGGIAQLRSQVQTGNVTWDVIDMQVADAIRACDEGLLEKISPADLAPAPSGTSASTDYLPNGLGECLAGNIVWSTLIAYDKSKFVAIPPTKIGDFFDLKKFPGKRGLRKSPEGAMEWALLADGVKAADVYKVLATPAGVTRAFKKLDSIKGSIVWWEAGAQPPQLLADGEVTMTGTWFSRVYSAITKEKKPFEFLWDGQVRNVEGYVIVKGAKNLKEAREFVKFGTSTEPLAALGNYTAYAPTRVSSIALVDPKIKPYLATTKKNAENAVDVDTAFWAEHSDDLNQKFAAWLNRK